MNFFKETGIADKLSTIEHLSTEEEYLKKSLEIITQHNVQFNEIDSPFSEEFVQKTPNSEKFKAVTEVITNFNLKLNELMVVCLTKMGGKANSITFLYRNR